MPRTAADSGERSHRADEPGRLQGQRLAGRYLLLRRIGSGGMAEVYRARDETTGREVAVKILHPRREASAHLLRREYQTLVAFDHPQIVTPLSFGGSEHGPFYTMELLEHGDLRDLERPVAVDRVCDLIRQLAVALAFIHARQFVHRDVTPANIRFCDDGRIKLIDFGVMTTAGAVPPDVAGTPPFLAPEGLRAAPIDHRADLFALGALAYWLLVGEHAYPSTDFRDLPERWRAGPPSARQRREDVPAELDELVRALLRPEPLARPTNAAEVIGRLTSIGKLDAVPSEEIAHSFITSTSIFGREEVVSTLSGVVERLAGGHGAPLVIRGASGMGKSRTLQELRVMAEVAEMHVIRVEGGTARENFLPQLVTAVRQAVVDAHTHPSFEVLQRLAGRHRNVRPDDAVRHLVALQDAVVAWFDELSQERRIVLMIDDAHELGSHALGFISALAEASQSLPIVVVIAHRGDGHEGPLRQLAAVLPDGAEIVLRGLRAGAVQSLVETTIGSVPFARRLATWLHGGTGGNPLACIEGLRALVQDGSLRFVDGLWSIDADLHRRVLPTELDAQLRARVESLSEPARELGIRLAIYRTAFDADEVVEIAGDTEPFAAVAQLVSAGLLLGGPNRYWFPRRAVRDALRAGADDDQRRALHLRAAEILGRRSDASDLEVGWHLLYGGRVEAGAPRLETAGRGLHREQMLSECIAPLEAALQAYDEFGDRRGTALDLRILILDAGIMVDRDAVLRHLDRARIDSWHQSGLEVAGRLRRLLGARLAFLAGIVWALAVWAATLPWRRQLRPDRALVHALASLVYGASVAKNVYDPAALEQLVEKSRVLEAFAGLTPFAAALMVRSFFHVSRGDWASVERVNREALDLLSRDSALGLTERERETARGEILNNLALVPLVRTDPAFLDAVRQADAGDLNAFAVATAAYRVCFHRLRGEESEAARLERELDARLARIGSLWIFEGLLLESSTYAYAHFGDLVGLRRTREALQRLVDHGVRTTYALRLATAVCDALVGELDSAAAALGALWADLPERSDKRLPVAVSLAQALLELRRFDRLDEFLDQAIEGARHEAFGNPLYLGHLFRIAAAADAERNELARAKEHLERAKAVADRLENPGLRVLVHEVRARLWMVRGDFGNAVAELAAMEKLARHCGNTVLLRRQQRLAQSPPPGSRGSSMSNDLGVTAMVSQDVVDLRGDLEQTQPEQRAERAASWVMRAVDAREVHMFARRDGRGHPVASVPVAEPSEEVRLHLRQRVEEQVTIHPDTYQATTTLETRNSPHVFELRVGPEAPVVGYLVTVGARRALSDATLAILAGLLDGSHDQASGPAV